LLIINIRVMLGKAAAGLSHERTNPSTSIG